MKKIKFYLFVCAMLFASVSHGQKLCEKLTITAASEDAPSSWLIDGKLQGSSVEYFTDIARKAGVKTVEVKVFDTWSAALNAARVGNVDMILSVGWSQERARYLNYVWPHYQISYLLVVVRKGSTFKLVKYDDLKGRQGVAIKDVTYGDGPFANLVNTSPDMRYTMNIADAFVELKSGAVDYFLGYENNVLAEMRIKNTFDEFEFVDTVPFALSEYAAFSKKSKCAEQLTKQFGKIISETRSRYDYYALQSKYKQLFTMSMADKD
jgi:ABC-type amino acid transport substrate-binding protein